MDYQFIKFDASIHTKIWEEINLSSNSSFLTSLAWIEFQKSLGKEVDQYVVQLGEESVAILYIEISRRRIAKYAYLPYGPVVSPEADRDGHKLWREIAEFGRKYCNTANVNYFKIDPLLDISKVDSLTQTGWKKSLSPGQAKDTWIMDISMNEAEILATQKKDTRYYMKYAGKKGVKVRKAESEVDVKKFAKLMRETMERNNFVNHPENYYLTQWKMLKEKNMCEIWLAEIDGVAISGALINYYKDTASYSHGASTSNPEFTKLASPYFLHSEIIKDAKSRGISKYNFWGVLPDDRAHPWKGLSDFKKKFNGVLVRNVGTYEVYSNPIKYYLNRIFDWYAFRGDRYQ